jgi:NADP-dependent 3-hydroxy acid dehydrogenase YdfG
MSVWFITGASRGFGAEIVEKALAAGHQVVATARDTSAVAQRFPNAGTRLVLAKVDVTDEAQVAHAVSKAISAFGRIDVLVNNAGRGLLGAVEEAGDSAVRALYDTNVFGVLNVIRATLPTMRAQRSGRIVNISSVGGFVGSPGWGIYNCCRGLFGGAREGARPSGHLGDDRRTRVFPHGLLGFVEPPHRVHDDRRLHSHRRGHAGTRGGGQSCPGR